MDHLSARVHALHARQDWFSIRKTPMRVGGCRIDEDCDDLGFACLAAEHLILQRPQESSSTDRVTVFDAFKEDTNWINPAATSLMVRAFDLENDSFATVGLSGISSGRLPSVESLNYMEMKHAQYRLLASQRIDEAMVKLQLSHIAEAIKLLGEAIQLDKQNVNAFFLRARAFSTLLDYSSALIDAKAALALTPENEALVDLVSDISRKCGQARETQTLDSQALPKKRRIEFSKSLAERNATNRATEPSSSSSTTQRANELHEFIPAENIETIERLQSSLLKGSSRKRSSRSSCDDSSSSNDRSAESSSSSDSDSRENSDDSRTRRHKRSKHHKKDKKKRKYKSERSRSKKSKHKKHRSERD